MDFPGLRTKMHALKPIQLKRVDDENVGSIDDGQPLSPIARLFHQPDSNVYIITMIGFKTTINPDIIKANLVHTLLKHPRFSSSQVFNFPCTQLFVNFAESYESQTIKVVDEKNGGQIKWVKAEVDMDNHVHVPKLDSNMKSPDKFVEDYISNLSKVELSMILPMWDLHLLNVKTSDAESVAVLRVHHSLGDGTSLMSLLLSCTRTVSDPTQLPTIPGIKKRVEESSSSCGFWHFFFKVWPALLVYWNTFLEVLMFIMTTFFLEDSETPLKPPSGIRSTPRRFVHRSISLDDVKLVKNAMNATVNDVMVGVIQAGLSHYLNRKYGEGKKNGGATGRNNYLPKNIRLRATSFVNIRASPGIQAFNDMIKRRTKAKWGNHIGYVLFPFTIALRDNPLDYIRDAKATAKRKKASLEANYTYFMTKYLVKFWSAKLASFPTRTTLWFSNVPGPQEEIFYCDHPVAYIAPSCYGQPSALMIHVASYAKKMTIVLSVDEGIIPDPHQLCDDFEESFKLIKEAVLA